MNESRDTLARREHKAVPCLTCGRLYYPGLPDDHRRPRDEAGKLIRVSMADRQGYCRQSCDPTKGHFK
jgi:hypothetical protein